MIDAVPHLLASLPPIPQVCEEKIIVGMNVPHVGDDGQPDRLRIECFRGRRATDPPAGPATRVQSNLVCFTSRAAWKPRTDCGGKSCRVGLVDEFAPGGRLLPSSGAQLGVGQTFLFSLSQCCWLDEHTLSLVALASPRPFHHDRL
jgi:hypothetical protein